VKQAHRVAAAAWGASLRAQGESPAGGGRRDDAGAHQRRRVHRGDEEGGSRHWSAQQGAGWTGLRSTSTSEAGAVLVLVTWRVAQAISLLKY